MSDVNLDDCTLHMVCPRCSGDGCAHCDNMGVDPFPVAARRTIRRLFTAYFLAKAKLRLADRVRFDFGKRMGVREERARIVAALRAKAAVLAIPGEHGKYEAHEVATFLANAIERGEL